MVLFEEKQYPLLREVWLHCTVTVGGAIAIVGWPGLLLFVGIYPLLCIAAYVRPLQTRLEERCLWITIPLGRRRTVALDEILRCEVIDYKFSLYRGVHDAPGVVFPSECIRVHGTRGVRLDLTDGLHLLVGLQE